MVSFQDQVRARPGSQTIIRRVTNSAFRTCLRAIRAKQAPSQIQTNHLAVNRNRLSRAGLGTLPAIFGTFRRVNGRQTAISVGEEGLLSRVGNGPVPLADSTQRTLQHEFSFNLSLLFQ